MHYLLPKDPVALLAPTNHPRIKCEETQINNSFESILDENVPYSIVIENITAEETGDMFKAFAMLFMGFLCIYSHIFNLECPKKLVATFLIIQKLASNFR